MKNDLKLFALFEEVSDQYGKSELVGIYTTKELAISNKSKTRRSYIQVFIADQGPVASVTYIKEQDKE